MQGGEQSYKLNILHVDYIHTDEQGVMVYQLTKRHLCWV